MKSFLVFATVALAVVVVNANRLPKFNPNNPNEDLEGAKQCAKQIESWIPSRFVPLPVDKFSREIYAALHPAGGYSYAPYIDWNRDWKQFKRQNAVPSICGDYYFDVEDDLAGANPCYNDYFSREVDSGRYAQALDDTPKALAAIQAMVTCTLFLDDY